MGLYNGHVGSGHMNALRKPSPVSGSAANSHLIQGVGHYMVGYQVRAPILVSHKPDHRVITKLCMTKKTPRLC